MPDKRRLIHDKKEKYQLALAAMMICSPYTGRFPENGAEFPKVVIHDLACGPQLNIEELRHSDLEGRLARERNQIIQQFFGFRMARLSDIPNIDKQVSKPGL